MKRLFFLFVALAILGMQAAKGAITGANFSSMASLPRASVCAFNLFYQYIGQSTGTRETAQQMMEGACSRGFRQIRFAASGFWPNEMQVWAQNSSYWWSAWNDMLTDAKALNCRLVPTVLWNVFVFADMNNETFHDFITGETGTSLSQFKEFLLELIENSREWETLDGEPLIAYWELSNELNLLADLNLNNSKAGINPPSGTPRSRTQQDNVSTADIVAFGFDVMNIFRANDQWQRPVSSGHAIAREQAYHLSLSYPTGKEDWTNDTLGQFATAFATQSAPFDLASVHMYIGDNLRFNVSTDPNSAKLLNIIGQIGLDMNTPTFWTDRGWETPQTSPSNTPYPVVPTVLPPGLRTEPPPLPKRVLLGEYGDKDPGPRTYSHNILQELQPSNISYSTIWIWEFNQTNPAIPTQYSIQPGRDQNIIDALIATNNQ